MKNRNSRKRTDHRALSEKQSAEPLAYLGEEWDFWWPLPVELTADPEEQKSQKFIRLLDIE